jgi:uncharacterized membrane-anchored protein
MTHPALPDERKKNPMKKSSIALTLMPVRFAPVLLAAAMVCSLASAAVGAAEKPKESSINWIRGPGKADLKSTAEIALPAGYRFATADDTRRLLKAAGEPVSGQELGMLVPDEGKWSVFFEFSPDGYVKDDEKDKLDADKLLETIIRGNDYGNEQRKKAGAPPLNIIGWEKKPSYDPETHRLEWAIRGESEGRPILNYNTRLLGRKGVMEVVLVCAPDKLAANLPTFKELLAGCSYKTGEKYAEFRPGDKVAKYGLAALVTGGAVAVAAKTGLLASVLLLFKKGWKLVVVGVVAVAAFFKRLILGASRRQEETAAGGHE